MRTTVELPRVSDTVDDVVVEGWEKAVGDRIGAGEVLLRVETAKALVDIPSPVTGRLVEQLVTDDQEITTGTALAVVESE